MDITLSNFNEISPEILKSIDECDFIAIDTEFTGLCNGPEVTAYDTPALSYSKLKDGSLDFLLIQVGLCTFKFDKSQNKYSYKAFNFYVFPRTKSKDVNFLCQSGSISFLTNSGFDFNKLFKEGIPYLSIADEEQVQEELVAKYDNLSQSESSFTKVTIPDELVETIEDACSRIEEFLSPGNEEKEIIFDKCNGFIRKLIFQTAYERFSEKNFNLSTKWVDNQALLVAQKGKSKADMEKENFEKEKKEISESVGFSRIIRYISNSKKLIVGHNMLLDICHIVNRFCWPLPDSYWEFKEMVHALFPRIIDTKYMCSAYPFRDLIPSSVMDHMMKRLHEPPFEFKEAEAESPEFGYSMNDKKAHEAGFDAYKTGLAFISLITYLGSRTKQTDIFPSAELVKPYENRLFIMRIIDYSYVNLKGEEPKPARKHVFHISFPKEWKTNDIMQLFNPYGNAYISYCNRNTAWVTLSNPEKADAVISDLIEANMNELPALRKPYTVVTCNQYCEERTSSNNFTRRSLKTVSNAVTSTPVTNSSPIVSQSSGDAELAKSASADVKSSTKRSSIPENVPRKRKKNHGSASEQKTNAEELMSTIEADEDSSLETDQIPEAKIPFQPKQEQLEESDDSVQKTFEEPPWE